MAPLTDAPVRVLIADDETLMRAGLRLMIDGAHGIEVIAEARTGEEAIAMAEAHDPDVILMDVRMPVMSGLDATRVLVERGARAGIVVLTAFDTDDYLLRALRAGAVSFLLKDSPPEAVVDAVLGAAAGEARFSPASLHRLVRMAAGDGGPGIGVASQGVADGSAGTATTTSPTHTANHVAAESDSPSGHGGAHQAAAGGSAPAGRTDPVAGNAPGGTITRVPAGITEREWDVAQLVAEGLTNAEIAQRLYLSIPTVKTHVTHLFDKMRVTNRVQLALRVIEAGGLATDGAGAATL